MREGCICREQVATGEEGYKTGGSNDRAAWLDNGLKGVDFEGNTASPFIDFATIHVYAPVCYASIYFYVPV